MRSRFALSLVMIAACVVAGSGCTHMQLQKNTNRQAKTVSAIYEEQVLDNLAMFVCNAYSTPFFSTAGSGTNTVTDDGSFGLGAGAFTLRFWNFVSAGGSRQMNQSWTLNPVVDPNRLKLMQCAYQRAVGLPLDECDQCCEIEKDWNGTDYCQGPCGITCGWVQFSDCWRDVPKCCCKKYGYHCGTYAWVDPCYEHEFSKLVMLIVEYASGDKAPAPSESTKEVRFYLNADNSFGDVENHAKAVIADVSSDASMDEIQKKLKITPPSKSAKEFSALEEDLAKLKQLALDPKQNEEEINSHIKRVETASPTIKTNAKAHLLTNQPDSIESRLGATIKSMESHLPELQQRIQNETPIATQQGTNLIRPRRDFGRPTQYNSGFGGSLLQLQQQLNTVAPRRNR